MCVGIILSSMDTMQAEQQQHDIREAACDLQKVAAW